MGSRFDEHGGNPPPHRPLIRLVRDFLADAAELLRQEIRLLRLEIAAKARAIGRHGAQVALGGSIAIIGVLALAAFLIAGLGSLLGGMYWLAALIVAIVLLAAGGGLVYLGVSRIGDAFAPPEATIASLRATGDWAAGEVTGFTTAVTEGAAVPALDAVAESTPPPARIVRATGGSPPGDGSDSTIRAHAPPRGSFFRAVLHEIGDDDVPGQAAKVAFFMFLSLPPALMVLFGLTGVFGGADVADYLTSQIQAALPGSADQTDSAAALVSTFVDQVVNENAPGPLSIGLLLGLWSSSAVFVATTEALNAAYEVSEHRSWIRRRATAIGVMFAFVLLFLSGSVVLIAGPQIASFLPVGEAGVVAWNVAQWPLAFLLVVGAFFIVYYVLPNRNQSASKAVLFKSSAIAAALWLIATAGFRTYIANFGSYSETYGFVGAILVLLLWMYVTGLVLLVGGEIGSEMELRA